VWLHNKQALDKKFVLTPNIIFIPTVYSHHGGTYECYSEQEIHKESGSFTEHVNEGRLEMMCE